jgi:hypothetical protein
MSCLYCYRQQCSTPINLFSAAALHLRFHYEQCPFRFITHITLDISYYPNPF